MSRISQDYFDELCVENYEVFDMGSNEEAVAETLTQLKSRQANTAHLSLTYPNDQSALKIRSQIRDFNTALRTLEGSSDDCHEIQSALDAIGSALREKSPREAAATHDCSLFHHLFLVERGFAIYFSMLSRQDNFWNEAIEVILSTVRDLVPAGRSTKFLISLQAYIPLAMPALMSLCEQELLEGDINMERISLSLSVIHASIIRCEANKKLWMKTQTGTSNFARLMLDTLKLATLSNDESSATEVGCTVCRILTALCTFDDFHINVNAVTPVVQSGHAHVQMLAEEEAVNAVHDFLLQVQGNTSQAAAAVAALRSMGIQDDIVQGMEKIGVMMTASRLLGQALQSKEKTSQEPLVTAIVGLFRNVAANDDIKTTLCTGKHQSVVEDVVLAMQIYSAVASLQEHACGLTAAMALRKPKNAAALVGAGVHLQVVAAMEQHPGSVTLQRQAALALRNLVARSPELRAPIMESAAEEALRTVAAVHLGCQDEVYAALRDLGLSVTSVHVQHSDDGITSVQDSRQMFGEHNPNFRPVYDD